MIRSGLRLKGYLLAALLLALGALSLQGVPAHAYLDEGSQEGSVSLDFQDGERELPRKGPGDGGGPTDPTRRADPDDLSFNNPRIEVPVTQVPEAPSRQGWLALLKLWLVRYAALFWVIR